MITAEGSAQLSTKLFALAGKQEGTRIRFTVDPSRMIALQQPCVSAAVPMLTGHGGNDALAEVIHTYHQWGEPVSIGLILVDGFFQFWVEKDNPT